MLNLAILSKLLDRVGDWNPQLWRELKIRLKRRNVLMAITLSIVGQILLLKRFSKLTCIVPSDVGVAACLQWHWKIDWLGLFSILEWILPMLLLIIGLSTIILDIAQEESRGTLNVIRLSPQSSQQIMVGKMLGVPILIYLGTASAIPLHFVSGLALKVPVIWMLMLYVFWGILQAIFYAFGTVNAFGTSKIKVKHKGWGCCFIIWIFGFLHINIANGFIFAIGSSVLR